MVFLVLQILIGRNSYISDACFSPMFVISCLAVLLNFYLNQFTEGNK